MSNLETILTNLFKTKRERNKVLRKARSLIDKGVPSKKEIARELDLSFTCASNLINLIEPDFSIEKQHYKQIKKAIDKGARTVSQIYDVTNIPAVSIRKVVKKEFKDLLPNYKNKPALLRKTLKEGVDSLEVLCNTVNSAPLSLMNLARRNKIKIPYDKMTSYKTRPKIDRMIAE